MIRQLREDDRTRLVELLAPEAALNLFIIGDVENYGFDAAHQQVWGDFDAAGRLRAVLLRYYGSFLPYAPGEPGEFDLDGLAALIVERQDILHTFSGIERMTALFEPYPGLLPSAFTKRTLSFLELMAHRGGPGLGEQGAGEERGEGWAPAGPASALTGPASALTGPTRAGTTDVPDYLALWRTTEGFNLSAKGAAREENEIAVGASRVYLFRDGDRVVSTVKTTAETSSAAMIVGVATHAEYRRRGLATRLLAHLCQELLAEGKRPCLFYDNPEAGAIYRRLGFTDVGTWVMWERPEAPG